MTTSAERAISDAVASMVLERDVADSLSHVVRACALAYPSDAVAILVRDGAGGLELLASSSHATDEIELLQIQSDSGPCAESVYSGVPIAVAGAAALVERWSEVGQAIVDAGFDSAHAYPMRWRGETVGGLNIFLRQGAVVEASYGPMLADLATLAVLQPSESSPDQLAGRIHEAVAARSVIEQAKGVLAHRDGVDMHEAYLALVEESRLHGIGLSAAARRVVDAAVVGPDRAAPGVSGR